MPLPYRTRPNAVRPSSLPNSTTQVEMAELRSASSSAKSPILRYRRFQGWDYGKGASFFITIATEPRRSLFGRVQQGTMVLSQLGHRVKEALEAIPRLNPGIRLYGHVVMPDHVHLCCHLAPGLAEPLQVLGFAIRRFKNYTTKVWKAELAERSSAISTDVPQSSPSGDGQTAFGQIGLLWQQGYHDLLCLSREAIDAVEHYIANNPLKWWLMYCDKSLMRVQEPLDSPLLDGTDIFWRGVGSTGLIDPADLGPDRRIVSMRISRRIPAALLPQVVADCLKGANAGYIYASTFFSPGEHALYNALVASGAPMIKLQTSKIGWGYRPVGSEPELFAAGRLLILAPMLAPATPSTRPELLDANRHAASIAHACPGGKAIYAVPGKGGIEYRQI